MYVQEYVERHENKQTAVSLWLGLHNTRYLVLYEVSKHQLAVNFTAAATSSSNNVADNYCWSAPVAQQTKTGAAQQVAASMQQYY